MRSTSFFIAVALLCASVLTGCNLPSLAPQLTTYQAFGDSITFGLTLSSPALAYPALIAQDYPFSFVNYAIPGAQACDVPTTQIFPNIHEIAPTATALYTLLIGTNDEDTRGTDYYGVFDMCHRATIAWLALPAEQKVLATSGSAAIAGNGELETANNWNSWMTSSQGASITLSITLANAAPLYLWPRIVDYDPGTFTYAVDGVVYGTFATNAGDVIRTSNAISDSLGFIRIPAVAAGTHTVTFSQTSATGTMRIVGIGAPSVLKDLPRVVVGDPPLQEVVPGSQCVINPAQCADYLALVQADVAIFAGDGLNVVYVDNHPYMHGTLSEMNDSLHPNPLGHSELRAAFETAIP